MRQEKLKIDDVIPSRNQKLWLEEAPTKADEKPHHDQGRRLGCSSIGQQVIPRKSAEYR